MANPPFGMTRIVPYLFYEDVASTLEWLTKAFGFVEHLRYTDDDGSVLMRRCVCRRMGS